MINWSVDLTSVMPRHWQPQLRNIEKKSMDIVQKLLTCQLSVARCIQTRRAKVIFTMWVVWQELVNTEIISWHNMTCWHDIFSVKHEHFDVLINSVKITHTQMTEGRRSKTSLNKIQLKLILTKFIPIMQIKIFNVNISIKVNVSARRICLLLSHLFQQTWL